MRPTYREGVKPFLTYTALRLLLFVTSLVIIGGIVALIGRLSGSDGLGSGEVFAIIALAAVVSAIGSWRLLARQREALAQVVEGRAARASEALERSRSKEDVD